MTLFLSCIINPFRGENVTDEAGNNLTFILKTIAFKGIRFDFSCRCMEFLVGFASAYSVRYGNNKSVTNPAVLGKLALSPNKAAAPCQNFYELVPNWCNEIQHKQVIIQHSSYCNIHHSFSITTIASFAPPSASIACFPRNPILCVLLFVSPSVSPSVSHSFSLSV